MKAGILILAIGVASWVQAQVPITQLYSFEWSGDSNIVDSPRYLTDFNANGYNNQPYFIDEDQLCFTLAWHIDDQTDIFHLDLITNEVYPITETASYSEYSPRFQEGRWTCVRVDTAQNQFLWSYPEDGEDQGKSLLTDQNKVGYYQFLNSDSIVVFLTGEPNKMGIVSKSTSDVFYFTSNIGRSFYIQDDKILYLHKLTEDSWYIKSYDPELRRASIVCKSMKGVEDFYVTKEGDLLAAKGAMIYKYLSDGPGIWSPWIDLSMYSIDQITRLVANEKYLIIVDKKNEE